MNKGFTLIEMLGVIGVLAIIGLISVPVVTNVINQSSNTLDNNQKTLIENAAKNYAMTNAFNLSSCVDVSTLKEEGYLENINIKDSKDNSLDNYSVLITKTPDGKKYEFNIQDKKCNE